MDFTRIIIDVVDGQIQAIYADETIDCYVCFREGADPDIFTGPVDPDKIIEDPSFLYVMPEIAKMKFEDGRFVERIFREQGIEDAWVCNCGNTPDIVGFTACLPDGTEIEPTIGSGWTKHYKCGSCGRVIEQDTLKVIAWAPIADATDEEQPEN